jgi:hypothetical protein
MTFRLPDGSWVLPEEVALMFPRRALGGLLAMALVPGMAPGAGAVTGASKVLQISYTNPTLVRAGEQVRMPVHVVCATADGLACGATVTLGTRIGTGPWVTTSAPATPDLQFDLTAPSARALAGGASAQVSFFLQARDAVGRTVTLPSGGRADPLRYFVTRALPAVRMPNLPFGRVTKGTTALFLPWGSGPDRAGLAPGRESATLGPSGFDVDRRGRIYLLDPLQRRVAVFASGRLRQMLPLAATPRAAVAVGADGVVRVADTDGTATNVQAVSAGGVAPAVPVGDGVISQLRVAGNGAFGLLLPLDAWVWVPAAGDQAPDSPVLRPGLPISAGSSLVRIGTEQHVRLAVVGGDTVNDALELRSRHNLGEISLAEADGRGGYWVVVHAWRGGLSPADHYEALHVVDGRVAAAFATASGSFSDVPPMSRFRLSPDGHLYQLTSSPGGMRLVRYDLGGKR